MGDMEKMPFFYFNIFKNGRHGENAFLKIFTFWKKKIFFLFLESTF